MGWTRSILPLPHVIDILAFAPIGHLEPPLTSVSVT
jgi:hypothetical protein